METVLSRIGLPYVIIGESNESITSAISCIIVYFSPVRKQEHRKGHEFECYWFYIKNSC